MRDTRCFMRGALLFSRLDESTCRCPAVVWPGEATRKKVRYRQRLRRYDALSAMLYA